MPEIGEVARVVHYLRKHLVNRTITSVVTHEDDIVYGKVGCSATAFQKHVQGRKVTGAAQQGKYFYITLDESPHPVLHLGMTGWMKFDREETHYYRQAKEKPEELEWPPKYAKFLLKCQAEKVDGEDREAVEVAFVDARRLARIRLVDCEADQIRKVEPLSKNGPDPIVDKEVFTVDFLTKLLRKKKVPVKALLLDQGNISGIGNWVADEVMYQARLHPEQYSNTFDDEQIKRLHDAIMSVCGIATSTLADSKQFPEDWLMKYRWDKGVSIKDASCVDNADIPQKKDANVLPNGNKIVHLKVGGRTSAIVPAVQKKTAAVAGDVDPADAASPTVSKLKSEIAEYAYDGDEQVTNGKQSWKKRARQEGDSNGGAEEEPEVPAKKSAKSSDSKTQKSTKSAVKKEAPSEAKVSSGSRRSSRNK
ncbi:hypothetical protein MRB53_038732 [Persea americana]|nr:hypothetical protein MRB53_038732 [Persea americana]